MERKVFLVIVPAMVFVALIYVLLQFFSSPGVGAQEEAAAPAAQECVPGVRVDCTTAEGCAGHRPCRLGELGECVPDYECSPGDVGPCIFTVCTQGTRTCSPCGRWGPCEPPECEGEYCAWNYTD